MRAWLVLLALLLAGCTDGGGAKGTEDDAFGNLEELDAGAVASDKGVIRGVVIDATITPISGASVAIVGTALATKTNENGAFLFKDLDPGTFFLEIAKPGFGSVQQSVDVAAGVREPNIVKVLIEALPGTEPRVVTYEDVGSISCGWGIPITYGYCGDTLGTPDDYRLQYEIENTPNFI